ncbi:hypothetical protein [Agarivorans sp. Alg241-V36]|uniref:hypothetical protein n=1 Tax=Agarivorans sp. Alg241-V36 TaxID=2305992 RepID=UPI0013D0C897|nr:hypothetical protein [Agarivorans sp. Alg241-V36]
MFFLFKESNSYIPDPLGFLKPIFLKNENYGEVLFTLASGYVVGFFVWFLDVYLPKRAKLKFAYSTLYYDYGSLTSSLSKLIESLELELDKQGSFLECGSGIVAITLSIDYPTSKDNEGAPCIHQSTGVFKNTFQNLSPYISFELDKIASYSHLMPMQEVNALVHLKHYVLKINQVLQKETLLISDWKQIIGMHLECCNRGLVLLERANKVGHSDKNMYLSQILNKRN